MGYKVLFRKRSIDLEYDLGTYKTKTIAEVVAKGEYYYRGGMTPDYRIVRSSEQINSIPEHLYDVLLQVHGFLSSEEQEVFRDHHIDYLKRRGLIPQWG